ncbi:MFS transporter [Couchioplanes caeruleus]|uniref:MFS transporter n=1 Tax=Couchioplanes caeruleus TaxID=56438 RepID=UPI0020BE34C1|nr:MFS transporter [Couchioplanes caeruleus]UQU63203.1 MFS transporter [Couchioplanes caeruleus]
MRRNAVLFVAISLLSGFGSTAMALVAGIWILDLTGSPARAGLAGLCVYAPALAGPWLGGLLDRIPRRPLLIGTNLALAVALLSLVAVRSAGQAALIYAVCLAYGLSYVLLDAGESALLPAALPPDRLGEVNGWRSSAQEGTKLVAPLAGAGLYAWRGGAAVAVLSAVMPLAAAALYALLRLRSVPPPPVPVERGLRAGLGVLRRSRTLRVTVALAGVSIGMSGFTTAPLYAVVVDDMALPSAFLGVLLSAQGAGSIVAGLVAGRLIAARGEIAVGVAGTVVFAAGILCRCLPWWPAMAAGAVIAGTGLPWTLIAAVTAVQARTPDHLLGRVSATAATAMFGPVAVANPLGSVAVHAGGRPAMIAAAVVCVASAAAVLLRPRRGPDRSDPAGRSGWLTGTWRG